MAAVPTNRYGMSAVLRKPGTPSIVGNMATVLLSTYGTGFVLA